jgi:hypothetical protein
VNFFDGSFFDLLHDCLLYIVREEFGCAVPSDC